MHIERSFPLNEAGAGSPSSSSWMSISTRTVTGAVISRMTYIAYHKPWRGYMFFKMAILRLAKSRKVFLPACSLVNSFQKSSFDFVNQQSTSVLRPSCCTRFLFRRNIWSSSRQDELTKALSDAEKIVGYPTSFLNLRYLLSDEISNVAMYMKRFAMSKHPLLRTARGFISDENHTMQTRGLLVLLISKASRPCLKNDWITDQELVADIYSSQRQLADITETIHTGTQVKCILCYL